MTEPVQGERGLWYVGTVGFATKEQAQAYIDRGMSHYSISPDDKPSGHSGDGAILGYPLSQWVIGFVLFGLIVGAAWWFTSGPKEERVRVGREFASMAQCLEFIANDLGDRLKVISDSPGDVSGKSEVDGLFFRCELMKTGTRGVYLEGRWDRLKQK